MLCSYNFHLYFTLLLFDLFNPIKGKNFKEEKKLQNPHNQPKIKGWKNEDFKESVPSEQKFTKEEMLCCQMERRGKIQMTLHRKGLD